jgi:DNA-directed RNA polymerase specialized sigma24 family protein
MTPQSLRERFNTSKEELAKLVSEFNSEALPLLEKLYNTSFWILLNKRAAKKIIKQTFYEAIENCDITKNYADWQSWIQRIWMREILDYYSSKENDTQTVFDFIDHTEVESDSVQNVFSSSLTGRGLVEVLEKLPAVLRIPLVIKEIYPLNYEKISDLIDVPIGVIATRIFRARKLTYLFLRGNFNYSEEKNNALKKEYRKIIFELRQCAMFVDDEMNEDQKSSFKLNLHDSGLINKEIHIQEEIRKLFLNLPMNDSAIRRITAKVRRNASKRFG